ncbi:MAG: hypothetical protein ITG07_08020 [Candidimonas sp.]|nr:hypothetical protein [Candidimonas sp.]
MRRFVFRILIIILLALSPVVFPVLLLWEGGRVTLSDLLAMYQGIYRALVRGFL